MHNCRSFSVYAYLHIYISLAFYMKIPSSLLYITQRSSSSSRHQLLRHNGPHTPPEITPDPPPPFPRISIHKRELIPQPRPLKLRHVRQRGARRHGHRRTASLVQINLIWRGNGIQGPIGNGSRSRGVVRGRAIGELSGDGRVGRRGEVGVDAHERRFEIRALLGGRGSVVSCHVCTVRRNGYGVLVLVR